MNPELNGFRFEVVAFEFFPNRLSETDPYTAFWTLGALRRRTISLPVRCHLKNLLQGRPEMFMFVNIFVATITAQVLTTLIAVYISPLKLA
jgi:hypothetical protein